MKVVRIVTPTFSTDREKKREPISDFLSFFFFFGMLCVAGKKIQKAEGVDTSTMVRLRKFHELNVRLFYRLFERLENAEN